MSYCPEHGGEMVCRNPDDYDGLVYDCPDGHTMIYSDGAYRDSSHLDYLLDNPPKVCGSCGADVYLSEPVAPTYPWHLWDDDCRAIRTPPTDDESSARYCGCGHADLSHGTSSEDGYSPCAACDCEDFSLPEDGGLTKGDDASTHPTQGMQDVMVVRGSQLVAKEYDMVEEEQTAICLCCLESRCAACWPKYDHTQEVAHTPDS